METFEATPEPLNQSDLGQPRTESDSPRLSFEQEKMNIEREKSNLSHERSNIEHEKRLLEDGQKRLEADRNAFQETVKTHTEKMAAERAVWDDELQNRWARLVSKILLARERRHSALRVEIAQTKTKRLQEVAKAEQAERDRIRAEIAEDRKVWAEQQKNDRESLKQERDDIDNQRGTLTAQQSEYVQLKAKLDEDIRRLKDKEERDADRWRKRHAKLDNEIADRLDNELRVMKEKEHSDKKLIATLSKERLSYRERLNEYEELKQLLNGEDPAVFRGELEKKLSEITRVRQESATRLAEETEKRFKEMKGESERMQAVIDTLEKERERNADEVSEAKKSRHHYAELKEEKDALVKKLDTLKRELNEVTDKLNLRLAAYERPSEVAARYKDIEMPHVKKVIQPEKDDRKEKDWLKAISEACDKYEMPFHPRILKAFHTALKTAEWSPLTVLAGVSGTGKSALPKLYAHFGGLLYEPLSVQPNWDSQESMLGFFNSIDNKFDAEPVLRLLAQTQQPPNETPQERLARWREMSELSLQFDPEKDKDLINALNQSRYPGLEDSVCLILLDEMNLAHPELYFAGFLSKLEHRRGMPSNKVPSLPVKIGAGLPPYQLPLGRNVLWTGTMNQDETTKSLSDKVLDRSIVIHFPRPTKLERRKELKLLDETNRGKSLHRRTWLSWLSLIHSDDPDMRVPGSNLSEEDIAPYQKFIEVINSILADTGRAIGHRVWQSVEYYMANYPDVLAAQKSGNKEEFADALHIAFEDQLVQKVMPKLRGLDTGGTIGKRLEEIRIKLTQEIKGRKFNLDEDFRLARELGYGQFIWQSANYIEADKTSKM